MPLITYEQSLVSLLEQYQATSRPINVNFRKLAPLSGYPERATHLIHGYPAKLIAHIPYFFLSSDLLSRAGDLVYDPFCGSGTVLVEALLAGRNAIGSDINPLAVLVSNVKTTNINVEDIDEAYQTICKEYASSTESLLPDVVNRDYWFHQNVQDQLGRLIFLINEWQNLPVRDFLRVCFSQCVKNASFADPRISVPVRLKHDQYKPTHWLYRKTKARLDAIPFLNVLDMVTSVVNANKARIKSSNDFLFFDAHPVARHCDVRFEKELVRDVQLVITSPPYVGAQKYIRSCSLNLGWLELCTADKLKHLDSMTIGREHYKKSECCSRPTSVVYSAIEILNKIYDISPLRARIAATYLAEMSEALTKIISSIRIGGYFILVIGNSNICGLEFRTADFLTIIIESLGMTKRLVLVDDIKSRGLMTKRNKTASIINREWVLVFQKRG